MYFSSEIHIGNLKIGGNNPVCVQSMTTTDTMDTMATAKQVIELVNAGCQMVRIATRNIKEANNLKAIREKIESFGIAVPLIADVHFNPKVAEVAAQYVEKVRINPGNYYSKINNKEIIEEHLLPLLEICRKYNTIIRIGVNHGSLSNRILHDYGNTPLGMVESLMEFVRVCHKNDFHNLVLSVKASSVKVMIESNLLLVSKLNQEGFSYPIHLGVTEAGSEEEGRIKSSVGIGYLLSHGIGDTIRISLAEDSVNEIAVANILVDNFGTRKNISQERQIEIIKLPAPSKIKKLPIIITRNKSINSDFSIYEFGTKIVSPKSTIRIGKFNYNNLSVDEQSIVASADVANFLMDTGGDGIYLQNESINDDINGRISKQILQALGLRISNAEYIACPTCARTSIGLFECLEELKGSTKQLSGLKLAVMGCIVNGPGEMADADYGIMGTRDNKVDIYRRNTVVRKNIPQDMAVASLIEIIKQNGDWK